MKEEDLVALYPEVYHMAESESWPSIREHGLLSTSALLDLFAVAGKERYAIESQRRPESVIVEHEAHGSAIIRDQRPLSEGTLRRLLDDMSPKEYYELLNRMTFFWARKERLQKLLNARAYKNRPHIVLTIDTRSLLQKHRDRIWLSPINSGATFRGGGRRGRGTFKRIADYPFEEMKRKKRDDAVVEVSVDYAVKDVVDVVTKVEMWENGEPTGIIWEKPQ